MHLRPPGYNSGMNESETTRQLWLTQERTVLIVVTLFAALGLGWLGWHGNWIRQRHAFLSEMEPKLAEISPSEVFLGGPVLPSAWASSHCGVDHAIAR
jgi:hypothetical protein